MLLNHCAKEFVGCISMCEELRCCFKSVNSSYRVLFFVGLLYDVDGSIVVFLAKFVVFLKHGRIEILIIRN